jgi:hypothetical protein
MVLATPKTKEYIEKRENGYWIQETRISLDSVVCSFLNGESPETITQNFPLLSLEQVYGAILKTRSPFLIVKKRSPSPFSATKQRSLTSDDWS